MIPAMSWRPRFTVENSTTTIKKLVEKKLVTQNKILIQLIHFSVGFLIEQAPKKSKSKKFKSRFKKKKKKKHKLKIK